MVDRGNSTARKTAITTINMRVVLLASLCLLSLASLLLNPNIDNLLPMVPLLDLLLAFLFSLLLVLFMVNLRLLCSALLMAENKSILRMTREIQGTTWTKITRNLKQSWKLVLYLLSFSTLSISC